MYVSLLFSIYFSISTRCQNIASLVLFCFLKPYSLFFKYLSIFFSIRWLIIFVRIFDACLSKRKVLYWSHVFVFWGWSQLYYYNNHLEPLLFHICLGWDHIKHLLLFNYCFGVVLLIYNQLLMLYLVWVYTVLHRILILVKLSPSLFNCYIEKIINIVMAKLNFSINNII